MRSTTAIALLLVMSGCVSNARWMDDEGFETSTSRPPRVLLEVENRNFADARLYAVRDGQRLSLGTVGGKENASFTIPWQYSQDVHIEINMLAGPTCTTDTLSVQPGDILELEIQSVFTRSSFCR